MRISTVILLSTSLFLTACAQEAALAPQLAHPNTGGRDLTPTCYRAGKRICTSVPVFFGTERKVARTDSKVIQTASLGGSIESPKSYIFGPGRAEQLRFGHAIVTVPRSGRKQGEIPRPSWFQRIVLRVPKRGDPAQHFTIPEGGLGIFANGTEFVASVQQHMRASSNMYRRHAFVFVHGYNVDFDEGLYRTAQIAYDLSADRGQEDGSFGTAFLYSWPSSGGALGYAYDQESARLTVKYLTKFIEIVAERSGAEYVHLIAHSMGNVALMNALARYKDKSPKPSPNINQVVLAAPDMSVGEFKQLSAKIKETAENVTLYASSNDVALQVSKNVHQGNARAGDVPKEGPVIVKGFYTTDISEVSTETFSVKHSAYADKNEIIRDMRTLFVKNRKSPADRDGWKRIAHSSQAVYWRYGGCGAADLPALFNCQ